MAQKRAQIDLSVGSLMEIAVLLRDAALAMEHAASVADGAYMADHYKDRAHLARSWQSAFEDMAHRELNATDPEK